MIAPNRVCIWVVCFLSKICVVWQGCTAFKWSFVFISIHASASTLKLYFVVKQGTPMSGIKHKLKPSSVFDLLIVLNMIVNR